MQLKRSFYNQILYNIESYQQTVCTLLGWLVWVSSAILD